MSADIKSPSQLRGMFGTNLRELARSYPSISELCRQLNINRTQFNRYLSGESFPRPDVLARICDFFGVDARVLLEPVNQRTIVQDPLTNPFLRDYIGSGVYAVTEDAFPNGFYRFSRRSFVRSDQFIVGLVYVLRKGDHTVVRGYESREAMEIQGLPSAPHAREFRGIVNQQEDGITLLVSRKNSMTGSFNYLNRVASFENNYWVGYVTRTVPETDTGIRATRLVYEFLGPTSGKVFAAARTTGFATLETLLPFHRRLLRPEAGFS